jgi:glycosyltransferase involved in cell wall biosynthesis
VLRPMPALAELRSPASSPAERGPGSASGSGNRGERSATRRETRVGLGPNLAAPSIRNQKAEPTVTGSTESASAEKYDAIPVRSLCVMHLAEPGGPPQHVRPWLEDLSRRGELEVVVPDEGRLSDLYAPLATTTVLPYAPLMLPRGPIETARLPRRIVNEVGMFRRHFERTRPDLVLIVTSVLPSALIAAHRARIPTIVYASEIFEPGVRRNLFRGAGGPALLKLTRRLATAIVACSRTVAGQFQEGSGAPVWTVYPGFDPEAVAGEREGFRSQHGLGDASPCLAVVGNVTRGRGQDLAIRAVDLLRHEFDGVRCVIAGSTLPRAVDQGFRRGLERLASELGIGDRVVFTGFVDRVGDVYAGADVLVNPARVSEALGRAALEALAARRPVVSTAVGAVPEVLRDGEDALLVEPGSPAAIASAVGRLWRSPELRERLVANGSERVARVFGERQGVEAFAGVVASVLDGAHRLSNQPGTGPRREPV